MLEQAQIHKARCVSGGCCVCSSEESEQEETNQNSKEKNMKRSPVEIQDS